MFAIDQERKSAAFKALVDTYRRDDGDMGYTLRAMETLARQSEEHAKAFSGDTVANLGVLIDAIHEGALTGYDPMEVEDMESIAEELRDELKSTDAPTAVRLTWKGLGKLLDPVEKVDFMDGFFRAQRSAPVGTWDLDAHPLDTFDSERALTVGFPLTKVQIRQLGKQAYMTRAYTNNNNT